MQMTDTAPRHRSSAKPGAKPSGRPLSRNVGVSLYATDEALAQAIGQGTTSRGVQLALRNIGPTLMLLAETREYVQREIESLQAAYVDRYADDLLRRIDEMQDRLQHR